MSVIPDSDLEIYSLDSLRRSRGGQHVAKGEPGVIVIHKPTGVAVVVDDQRSQMGCKTEALIRLGRMLDAPMDKARLDRLRRLVCKLEQWNASEVENDDNVCVDCGQHFHLADECDPAPTCNGCAHRIVDELGALLGMIP